MRQEKTGRFAGLKSCFNDPLLDVMNFLNEIMLDYPQAISFAPGRPPEAYFDVENSLHGVRDFVAFTSGKSTFPEQQIWDNLGQYGRTNGMIADLIANQLAIDEDIHVSPESIIVTVGAQEAMTILLAGLFDPADDLLLVSDPSYIGITGLARILGIRIVPVPTDDEGLNPTSLEKAIRETTALGRLRALYDIPDFNNPKGTTLSLERRLRILQICKEHGIWIIEDNPYGMFCYDGTRPPTLKALDAGPQTSVLYVGSYAKTVYPGLRLGYLVSDQEDTLTGRTLAHQLSKIKSLLTVNTSPLLQALLAGILLSHGGSLKAVVRPKKDALKKNRDTMLKCLAAEFSDFAGLIHWNRPAGGFFITVTLPFEFGEEELRCCASKYGVLVVPMQFFTVNGDRSCRVRLSFSCIDEGNIQTGVQRFGAFVRERYRLPLKTGIHA